MEARQVNELHSKQNFHPDVVNDHSTKQEEM